MSEKVAPMNDITSPERTESGGSSSIETVKLDERNINLRKHAIYHSLYRLFPNHTQNS